MIMKLGGLNTEEADIKHNKKIALALPHFLS